MQFLKELNPVRHTRTRTKGTEMKPRKWKWSHQPHWWHHAGREMQVEHKPPSKEEKWLLPGVHITSSLATVMICPVDGKRPWKLWEVDYKITFGTGQGKVNGRILLPPHELRSAFGLPGTSDRSQGLTYIRWGPFLNVPCQGTGQGNDPNLSILVSEEMRVAIKKLLEGKDP